MNADQSREKILPRMAQSGKAATKLNWPQENAKITKKKTA
jgi:hypothetical protein